MLFYVRQVKICSSVPLRIQSKNDRNQHMKRLSSKNTLKPLKRPNCLCFFAVFRLCPLCEVGTVFTYTTQKSVYAMLSSSISESP